MKILTLNCHSLAEENYQHKLKAFAEKAAAEKPQIIALQEVNQSIDASAVSSEAAEGYIPAEKDTVIKSDNHALNLSRLLRSFGYPMQWTWAPAKIGYGKYEEGLAIFSSLPILRVSRLYTTVSRDFNNWKVRKALSAVCEEKGQEIQFITVHMGWWEDEEEPFKNQWKNLESLVEKDRRCFVMGDFNSPASVKGAGYDYILSRGWKDTYLLASEKDDGFTVCKAIDGWRSREKEEKMRIDFIFSDRETKVSRSKVVFNGADGEVVSDHFGVMITL